MLLSILTYAAVVLGHHNIGGIDLGMDPRYTMYGPIDVVYTWVNGSDVAWRSRKDWWYQQWIIDNYVANLNYRDIASTDNRYRDNDELRYSIRSLEMYAPWVRHVYIVSDGQVPSWLKTSSPHISIVPHTAMFRNISHLPSFSSPSIEANLDGISGLSEHFIYLNDDFFLDAPVYPSDFISEEGTMKLYLSKPIPNCAAQCGHVMLGDGVCQRACNTARCNYDIGDCTATEVPIINTSKWDAMCSPLDYSPLNKTEYCSHKCRWDAVGDGACQLPCNLVECGFDAGDCNSIYELTELVHVISPNDAFVLIEPEVRVIAVNTTSTPFQSNHTFQRVVQGRHNLVFLFLDSSSGSTVFEDLGQSKSLELIVDGHVTNFGFWSGASWNVSMSHLNDVQVISHIPFAALTSFFDPLVISANSSSATSTPLICPRIDSTSTALVSSSTVSCSLTSTGYDVVLPVNSTTCFTNGDASKCIRIQAAHHVQSLVNKQPSKEDSPYSASRCMWYRWCDDYIGKLLVDCVSESSSPAITRNMTLATQRALALSIQLGDSQEVSTATTDATRELVCKMLGVADPDPFWLLGSPAEEKNNPPSRNPFRDSLRHVNALLTTAFGQPKAPRRMVYHMPLFIKKSYLIEMKALWPKEFDATSRHRFRHPADMQFAFAYTNYVINRRRLHPPSTVAEVINSFIDLNGNDIIDFHEERNAVRLLVAPQLPESAIKLALKQCQDSLSAKMTAEQIERSCPALTRWLTNIQRVPEAYRLMPSDDVAFLMLGEAYRPVFQLERAAASRRKFICINDDMINPTSNFTSRLHDFFEKKWSNPSSFELVKPEDRSSLMLRGHGSVVDQLWFYQLSLLVVSSGVVLLLWTSRLWRYRLG